MDYGRKSLFKLVGIAGVLIGITSFFHCCVSSSNGEVDFQLAHGYFVRNDINLSDMPLRIDNPTTFEKFFGAAPVMGPNGMPTKLDFSNSTVIPVVLPSTDKETEMKVLGCNLDKGLEVFKVRYKVIEGQKQSFVITPMQLVIVPKLDNKCKIELIKE